VTHRHVDLPGDLTAVGQRDDSVDQFEQDRLVVGDASGQKSLPIAVDDHAVVRGFSGVDADPQFYCATTTSMVVIAATSPTDDHAVVSLRSDRIASLN
jgi:hypothetical protein